MRLVILVNPTSNRRVTSHPVLDNSQHRLLVLRRWEPSEEVNHDYPNEGICILPGFLSIHMKAHKTGLISIIVFLTKPLGSRCGMNLTGVNSTLRSIVMPSRELRPANKDFHWRDAFIKPSSRAYGPPCCPCQCTGQRTVSVP
jgi:hypothetical protein